MVRPIYAPNRALALFFWSINSFYYSSHPFIAIWHLYYTALAPAAGHSGFDKIQINKNILIDNGDYFHYLHHKHFECNYSSGGANVIDKIFNTFYDGDKKNLKNIVKKN